MVLRFPQDFLWGVATASYQIEGAPWEDGKGESIWDRFTHTPGTIADGTTGDVACDHYHRFEEDLRLMRDLGISAYRFSLAWPRIFPQGEGKLNEKGLSFYERLIDMLCVLGIEPVVTLYHWDLPQALQDMGGWENERVVRAFEQYAGVVFRRLGDRVKLWITHNEPWVVAFVGHYTGEHAPGLRDFGVALRVAKNLLVSHGLAVRTFREIGKEGEIGITLSLSPIHAFSEREEDQLAQKRFDGYFNRFFLDPLFRGAFPADVLEWYAKKGYPLAVSKEEEAIVSEKIDFLGVNYYSRQVVRHGCEEPLLKVATVKPEESQYTDMGWEIYPQGILEIVERVFQDYAPRKVFITENGIALPDQLVNGTINDGARIAFLREHLRYLHRAIQRGYAVKGYFVWSLLDNFEWAFGLSKRFGLVFVDYATGKRFPKESFFFYREVIEKGIEEESQ